MQENQIPSSENLQPEVSEVKNESRDYLAPALVFIALFFSFFVLITMQRLTRKVIDGEPYKMPILVDTQETSLPAQKPEPTVEEQMELDSKATPATVGDDILKDIDSTATDMSNELNTADLDDLAE